VGSNLQNVRDNVDKRDNFLILGRMQKGMFEPIESSSKDSSLVTSEYKAD
jgi:hypothetical protein